MTNKKRIIITALAIALTTGFTTVRANNANSLLQMDVKKSSAANTVDVTFYTTESMGNSVVTRKGNNRYVVLLPNVKGSSASSPSIGGVKDMITDVNVKNVDDGIGGYTKVTFTTTKPINIKTYVKKTSPLTQAQKDTKNIIAQNNKPAIQPVKAETPAPKAAPEKPQNTAKPQAKPAQTSASKPVEKPKAEAKTANPVKQTQTAPKTEPAKNRFTLLPVAQPKAEVKHVQNTNNVKVSQKPNTVNTTTNTTDSYVPKMKFDENGRRQIDLEPRVVHEITKNQPSPAVKDNLLTESDENIVNTPVIDETSAQVDDLSLAETPTPQKSSNSFPIWAIVLGAGSLVFGALYLVWDAVTNSSKKNKDRLASFYSLSSRNHVKRRNREYQDIIEDDTLNWQEKFKKYTQKERQLNPVKPSNDITYVTDLSATKKAMVMPDNKPIKQDFAAENVEKTIAAQVKKPVKEPIVIDEKQVAEIVKKTSPRRNDELTNKLRAKISQMEHALSQTPSANEPQEVFQGVQSEDNAITSKLNDIKLKSFSKPVSLRQTLRTALTDDKKLSKNKPYKEGRFVKLKNSPLSVNRRKSASSEMNAQDLNNTENKYLTNENNGEMTMDKQNENYLLSSLNEYISILDTEDKAKTNANTSLANALSKFKPSDTMTNSRINTTGSRATNPLKSDTSHYMNGLVVKSGYNIDSEKGFYLVNMNGASALVGRVGENIFVLKKFDTIVDKPIQVRQDYGTVYIVKAGGFKCLVDVAKDKMGTLIEI